MTDHSPRHLILTLLGLYARDGAYWMSARSLIGLMEDLDVDASATRSSVSRLKKRGSAGAGESRRTGRLPVVGVGPGSAP